MTLLKLLLAAGVGAVLALAGGYLWLVWYFSRRWPG